MLPVIVWPMLHRSCSPSTPAINVESPVRPSSSSFSSSCCFLLLLYKPCLVFRFPSALAGGTRPGMSARLGGGTPWLLYEERERGGEGGREREREKGRSTKRLRESLRDLLSILSRSFPFRDSRLHRSVIFVKNPRKKSGFPSLPLSPRLPRPSAYFARDSNPERSERGLPEFSGIRSASLRFELRDKSRRLTAARFR